MKQVYSAGNELEAQRVQAMLEEEGIEAAVQDAPLSVVLGHAVTSPETLPGVWVNEEDAARARELVERLDAEDLASRTDDDDEASDEPTASAWKCAACGEFVEPQFDACWNCSTPRPPAA